jgi:hypothetical protein
VARTSKCDRRDAEVRLAHARKFLEVAELVGDVAAAEESYSSVAASLAVLSGIASADAACCVALGQRSRSQDHHDAEQLVDRIEPGGKIARAALRRLLNVKDEAQYGVMHVSGAELKTTIRQARQLLTFAESVFQI